MRHPWRLTSHCLHMAHGFFLIFSLMHVAWLLQRYDAVYYISLIMLFFLEVISILRRIIRGCRDMVLSWEGAQGWSEVSWEGSICVEGAVYPEEEGRVQGQVWQQPCLSISYLWPYLDIKGFSRPRPPPWKMPGLLSGDSDKQRHTSDHGHTQLVHSLRSQRREGSTWMEKHFP